MTTDDYELRVIAGAQQGARTRLPAGAAVTLSGRIDSDVVLRGEGLAERRIALTAAGDGLRIDVLEGDAEVGGRRVGAGHAVTVALETPIAIGGACVAVARLNDADGANGPTDARASAPTTAVLARTRQWPRRLAAGGAALAAVSIGVLAFAYNAAPLAPTPEQRAQRAEAVLRGAGMPRLAVHAEASGELRVDGYLETNAQRAQAEALLAGIGLRPRWQVWVNEQVANAVQDVFRVHGVPARVEAVGPGAVRVSAVADDPALLDRLRSTARHDVPGLAAIELRAEAAPRSAAAPAAIDDPGKRVASVVPGEPAYVVTADGTRYFEGALLPTGHRIAGIDEHRVVLELNGVKTPLVF